MSEGPAEIKNDPLCAQMTALAHEAILKWGMGRNNSTVWALHEAVDAGVSIVKLERARKRDVRDGEHVWEDPIWEEDD